MTKQQQVMKRLRALGVELPGDTELRRIRAGWVMKARGCWSWFAWSPTDASVRVGSQYPMTELLRAAKWDVSRNEFGEVSIDPSGDVPL